MKNERCSIGDQGTEEDTGWWYNVSRRVESRSRHQYGYWIKNIIARKGVIVHSSRGLGKIVRPRMDCRAMDSDIVTADMLTVIDFKEEGI
jgi:hypothetical protein